MGKLTLLFLAGLVILPAVILYNALKDTPAPKLPAYYWGPKEKESAKEDTSIRPFKINVNEKILNDLKTRLKIETSIDGDRLTPPLEGIGFEYGFNTEFLKTITNHWLNKYDWATREKALNKYPQFKTTIAGIEIHYQHVKGNSGPKKYKSTRPLLLLHGWPGSFVEFQKVIPLLTQPENSDINFELVIPSLPGYGFSERAHRPGMGPAEVAQVFLKLMKRIGHEEFFVQGGDWGSQIATNMATMYPENVMGLHINMCISIHRRTIAKSFLASIYPPLFMTADEAKKMFNSDEGFWATFLEETGYFHIQATKPDTIGVSLSNSPSGLAAYILEKFSTATNIKWRKLDNGGLTPYFNLDDLLDNIMVYWVTNSITSSIRLYSEVFTARQLGYELANSPVTVPTGCLDSPNEVIGGQNKWLLRDKYPLISVTKGEKGGHFSAFEVPELFSKDVLQFFSYVDTNRPNRKL